MAGHPRGLQETGSLACGAPQLFSAPTKPLQAVAVWTKEKKAKVTSVKEK